MMLSRQMVGKAVNDDGKASAHEAFHFLWI